MKKYNVELGFISKLLETKDMTTVKDRKIRASYFTGVNRKAFAFIEDYFVKNGEIPTVRTFKVSFPSYELETYVSSDMQESIGTEETLNHWCDEIRRKVKHNTLADLAETIAKNLEENNSDKAHDLLRKGLLYIENEIVESNSVDITQDVEDRIALYLKRKENKGMIGISTGIDALDYYLKGIQKKQLITMIARTATGKANPLSSPVLTPSGFIPMGDIHAGSYIIGEDGNPHRVTSIHPQGAKEVFKVTFDDGTSSRCTKEHLWKFKTTDDRKRGNDWRVDTLENMLRFPLVRGRAFNLVIPVSKEVSFSPQNPLPLHPYVLGVLLGDGNFTCDSITLSTPEKDIVEKCNSFLCDFPAHFIQHDSVNELRYLLRKPTGMYLHPVRTILRSLGLLDKYSSEKFIPSIYLMASVKDRRLLLAGLLDTDGSISSSGDYSFSTVSHRLVTDIMFLSRSLGYRCSSSTYDRTSVGKGVEYAVRIRTRDKLFLSDKHLKKWESRKLPKKGHDYSVMKIVRIESDGVEECQCISVDSQDHTYLVDDFIVTHNTWFEVLLGAHAQLNGLKVLQFVTEMSEEVMRDRYEAMLFGIMQGDFNYSRFKSGTLSPDEEKEYFHFLRHHLPRLEPLLIEEAIGVSSVAAKIEQHKPDLILIDGAYLMEDERGAKDDWLRVAHITRDLKLLCKRKDTSIFINSQADSTTSKKTGPELENIGYSKAIGQDSDVVLALFQDEQMREDREMKIKILKQREGILGSVVMTWDFSTMTFESIYSSAESESPENKSAGAKNIVKVEEAD